MPSVENVLGPLGAAVMRTLWARGEASVAEVLEMVNDDRPHPLAYTTVMTILVRLHERGLLHREKRGRGYVYRAAVSESALVERLSGRAVDELVARYGATALRHFADRLADADPEVRARILELAQRRGP